MAKVHFHKAIKTQAGIDIFNSIVRSGDFSNRTKFMLVSIINKGYNTYSPMDYINSYHKKISVNR